MFGKKYTTGNTYEPAYRPFGAFSVHTLSFRVRAAGARYFFGAMLTRTPIRFVAIAITVSLAFAFRLIGGAFFPVPLTIAQTFVIGALSGLSSNLVHVILGHFGVKNDKGSLGGLLAKKLNGKRP